AEEGRADPRCRGVQPVQQPRAGERVRHLHLHVEPHARRQPPGAALAAPRRRLPLLMRPRPHPMLARPHPLRTSLATLTALAVAAGASGCTFNEDLTIRDFTGTVKIPKAAATRTFTHTDGSTETITDVKLIGPVYLGFFPSVQDGLYPYPHPEEGP